MGKIVIKNGPIEITRTLSDPATRPTTLGLYALVLAIGFSLGWLLRGLV